ncbi:MAG TPA: peptidylprolyl isomerase [Pseudomonadales bacterium]|nr:peptidylprolyl isomerase [Pseudomonadales bacterium]
MRHLLTSLLLAACLPAAQGAEEVLIRTGAGDLRVVIETDRAPITAANFRAHLDAHGFEGATFYRVVRDDNQPQSDVKIGVIQGGLGFDAVSPLADIAHEDTRSTGLRHVDGALSMARGAPGTANSEFFVCVGDQPELDFGGRRNPDGQGFAVFGRVVAGMDVVRRIQAGTTPVVPAGADQIVGQMLTSPVPILAVEPVPGPDEV